MKTCRCGAQYNEAQFSRLRFVGYQRTTDDHDHLIFIELRDCSACQSTIGLERAACDVCGGPVTEHETGCPEVAEGRYVDAMESRR